MKRSGLNSAQTLGMNNTIMFLYGLSAVLIGPTLPGMIDEFSLSLSAGGLVSSMQNAGGFAGAVIALFVADRLSRPGTVIVSFVLLALALIGVGLSRGYLSLVLLFAATGLFIRVLDVMLNAHTGEVGHAAAMSRLHMFFSIGAFVGPIIARAVMDAGTGWDDVYRSVGAVYLIVAVLALPRLRRYLHHRAMDEADAADGAERRHADAETESAPEPEPVAPATPSVDERAGGGVAPFRRAHDLAPRGDAFLLRDPPDRHCVLAAVLPRECARCRLNAGESGSVVLLGRYHPWAVSRVACGCER